MATSLVCARCGQPWCGGSPATCPGCGQAGFGIAVELPYRRGLDYREKMRAIMKKLWQDADYRARQTAKIRQSAQNAEYRAKQSAARRRRAQDPAYREQQRAVAKKRWQDADYRARQMAAIERRRAMKRLTKG